MFQFKFMIKSNQLSTLTKPVCWLSQETRALFSNDQNYK